MTLIACTNCKEEKPETDEFFVPAKNKKNGLSSHCRECVYRKNRLHQQAHPERHRDSIRRSKMKRKYGITPEQRDAMAEEQGGLCAICREDPIEVVEHCHDTGVVRGLACQACNKVLGFARDSIERLQAAIEYLERSAA